MQFYDIETIPVEHVDRVFSAMVENDNSVGHADLTDDVAVVEPAKSLLQDQEPQAALPLWLVSAMVGGSLSYVPTFFNKSDEEKETWMPEWMRRDRKNSGNRSAF